MEGSRSASRWHDGTVWFSTRSGLRSQSLADSFEARDAWLASGMETGLNDGYAKLQRMVDDDAV